MAQLTAEETVKIRSMLAEEAEDREIEREVARLLATQP